VKTLSDALGLRYIKAMNNKVAPVRHDLLDRIRAVVRDNLESHAQMVPSGKRGVPGVGVVG
jgi:hypothetical protein